MLKTARFLKQILSQKELLNRKKLGVVCLLFSLAAVFSWQMFSGTTVDAKIKGLKTKDAKIAREATRAPISVTATSTPVPTTPPVQPTSSSRVEYPSQLINLTNWKLTLPIGSSEKPAEIKQPALSTYKSDPYFLVTADGSGVRFRAPVNGVTTSGSGYPRSELREMSNGGTTNASWSSTSGTHTMFLDQAITSVPQTKKHVVSGQIHDAGDDVIVIRLEYPNLYVNVDGKNAYKLDSNYTLGKRFTVKFVVSGGQTKVYYNNSASPVYTLNKSYSGAYFKAGAYTQSNCSKESSSSCNNNNFGEVVIYQAIVTH